MPNCATKCPRATALPAIGHRGKGIEEGRGEKISNLRDVIYGCFARKKFLFAVFIFSYFHKFIFKSPDPNLVQT